MWHRSLIPSVTRCIPPCNSTCWERIIRCAPKWRARFPFRCGPGLRLRLWFLAQDALGRTSVALAEARSHDTALLELELPEPLPFVVNPILDAQSTLVRSGCTADECTITGIAVTPRADDPDRLRFLLARRLKEEVVGGPDLETYQLIPLEQTWRTP